MRIIVLISLVFISFFQCIAQPNVAEKVTITRLKNLYKISDDVYRSEQPNKNEFERLEDYGIKTVLNFRRLKENSRKAKGTQLQLERLPLRAAEIDEEDIINALQIINNAEKPILIHCWHGSDRTGVVSAAYRIVFDNWSKEQAIKEFRQPQFGYHEKWYPNLVELLNNLDVPKIKSSLGI